jgi:hypothetical protein
MLQHVCVLMLLQGMSVKEIDQVSGEEATKIWKGKYGIPLGKMGTAQDYAKVVLSTITVSSTIMSGGTSSMLKWIRMSI